MDISKADAVLKAILAILAARQPDALRGLTLTDLGNEYWINSPPIKPDVQNAIRSAIGAPVAFWTSGSIGDAANTDILERLRKLEYYGRTYGLPIKAAADEIERLREASSAMPEPDAEADMIRLRNQLSFSGGARPLKAAADEIKRLRELSSTIRKERLDEIAASQEVDARFGRQLRDIADVLDPQ